MAVLLAVIAAGVFLPAPLCRAAVVLAAVVSLVIWVAGQDLGGILAGRATDPNSAGRCRPCSRLPTGPREAGSFATAAIRLSDTSAWRRPDEGAPGLDCEDHAFLPQHSQSLADRIAADLIGLLKRRLGR